MLAGLEQLVVVLIENRPPRDWHVVDIGRKPVVDIGCNHQCLEALVFPPLAVLPLLVRVLGELGANDVVKVGVGLCTASQRRLWRVIVVLGVFEEQAQRLWSFRGLYRSLGGLFRTGSVVVR